VVIIGAVIEPLRELAEDRASADLRMLRWAIGLVWAQAGLLGVETLLLVYVGLRDPEAWISLPIAVCTAMLTLVLVGAAGMLHLRWRWAPWLAAAPQLLHALIGAWAWIAGWALGGPTMALAVIGAVLALVRPTKRALRGR
jgi:hypothetical protein